MAQRRFLSINLLQTSKFLRMTNAQKLLYVYLTLTSDDDGFNTNIETQLYYSGAKKTDIDELEKRKYVLLDSESDSLCIVDWHIHNAVPTDRYKQTDVIGFKNKLFVDNYARLTFDETSFRYSDYKGGSLMKILEKRLKKEHQSDNSEDKTIDDSEPTDNDSEMTEEEKNRREELFEQYDEMKQSGQY